MLNILLFSILKNLFSYVELRFKSYPNLVKDVLIIESKDNINSILIYSANG